MEKLRNDARTIEKVRVVVHTTGPWPNSPMSDNRWSIFLVLPNNSGSVRLNMTADLSSTKAIRHWDYMVNPGVTVAKVYGIVMGNRRDQYDMSGGGSGCRWWIYTVIKDIEGKGFLTDKTAATDLWPKLHYRYSLKSSPTKLGMVKGTFTAVSTSVASSSSAGPSSSTSTSASLPPTRVKVTRHMTGGQLWYAWKSGGLDDRGLANEWITVKDQNGAAVVVHKAKNLVSTPP